jgi:hypothetical protein
MKYILQALPQWIGALALVDVNQGFGNLFVSVGIARFFATRDFAAQILNSLVAWLVNGNKERTLTEEFSQCP